MLDTSATPAAPAVKRISDAAPRGGAAPVLVPLGCIAALFALSFLPRFAREPMLVHSTRAVAALLLAWLLGLLLRAARGGPRPAIDVRILTAHYVQTFNQSSILAWWAFGIGGVALVREELWLIAAQLLMMYALDAVLSYARRGVWVLGFGVVPMTLSTNFFLWFRDEWFFLQYGMIALVLLGKEFVRWQKDGKSTHIFNPSSFALSIASLALIAAGATDMTWGPEQAVSIGRPAGMLALMFVIGLVPQVRFAVTPMTFCAVATVLVFDAAWWKATGDLLFTTTVIPPAVYFGSIFLFTDPSTSPRSPAGRVIYGVAYGTLVCVLYVLFQRWDIPEFYDKILPIPALNLSVRAIERLVATRPFSRQWLSPAAANRAFIAAWATLFWTLWLGGLFGSGPLGEFPGVEPGFWKAAADRGQPGAREKYMGLLRYNAADLGDISAADRLGWELIDGKYTTRDPYRALQVFLEALRRAGAAEDEARRAGATDAARKAAAQSAALTGDLVLAYLDGFGETEPGPVVRPAFERVWQGAAAGDPRCCYIVGYAMAEGRSMPRDPARAAPLLQRACEGGVIEAFEELARLCEGGDGVPRNPARAAELRSRAEELRKRAGESRK